MYKKMILLSG